MAWKHRGIDGRPRDKQPIELRLRCYLREQLRSVGRPDAAPRIRKLAAITTEFPSLNGELSPWRSADGPVEEFPSRDFVVGRARAKKSMAFSQWHCIGPAARREPVHVPRFSREYSLERGANGCE